MVNYDYAYNFTSLVDLVGLVDVVVILGGVGLLAAVDLRGLVGLVDLVGLLSLVVLVDLVLSCGLFFMNLIHVDGFFLLHSNCFSVRTIFLAYIIIDRCSLISFCTHNFLCQNILMLTLGSQSLIYSYFS